MHVQRYPQPVGLPQSGTVPSQRSPHAYSHDRPIDYEGWWDCRMEYPSTPPAPYPSSRASPLPLSHRGNSPMPPPHSSHGQQAAPSGASSYHSTPPHHDQPPWRYGPLGYDDRRGDRGYGPVEASAGPGIPPPRSVTTHPCRSESPRPTPGPEYKCRRATKDYLRLMDHHRPLLPVKNLRRNGRSGQGRKSPRMINRRCLDLYL